MKTVGVLALQGDFSAHVKAMEKAGARSREVRTVAGISQCDALILPGGESTTMLKLLQMEDLMDPLRRFGERKPIFGTCAGAILLSRIVLHPTQPSLKLIDTTVERNAYGRQIDSRIVTIPTEEGQVEAVFIRAPIIRRTGPKVRVLASYDGNPVWIEDGMHMVTTFHPELTGDNRVHRRFLQNICGMEARPMVVAS